MKVTIQKLLATKFVGVGDAILSGIAERKAKTIENEAQAKEFVDGLTIQNILESYGDQRANDAAKTAVKNYETKHGIKDGKVIEIDNPQNENPGVNKPQSNQIMDPAPAGNSQNDATPAWASALMKANEALMARIDAIEKGDISKTRSAEVAEIIKAAPASVANIVKLVDFNSMDADTYAAFKTNISSEVKSLTNQIQQAEQRGIYKPFKPDGDPSQEATDDEVKALFS